MHLGSLIGIVESILERVPASEIKEGDVFVGNDAYTGGGTHLPDIVLAEPIFFQGTLVGWATNTAHHADFVDRGHAHIFQEGIRIPPIRLYREGQIVQDVLDLILLNLQVPHERLNDLRAQMAANRQGVLRFQALCRRYGLNMMLAVEDALLDYAERLTRAGIKSFPPGVYEFADQFDSEEIDEILDFKVRIEVKSDEIFLDFEAPPQVRAGLQSRAHWTAGNGLLRPENCDRAGHSSQRRLFPANPRVGAERLGAERGCAGCSQLPRRLRAAGCRSGARWH